MHIPLIRATVQDGAVGGGAPPLYCTVHYTVRCEHKSVADFSMKPNSISASVRPDSLNVRVAEEV